MRLTLRNLLRFLDQTDLGSLERQRLEELVSKSDRAAAWIQRIQTLRTNPKKSAPALHDQPGAAWVARYLDGSLSEQEIVSFEETLLNSDRNLAEVASSHLVLQRLGVADPPAIPVTLRQSLYDIERVFHASQENRPESDDSNVPTSMEDLPFIDASETEHVQNGLGQSLDVPLEDDEGQLPPVSLDNMTRRANGRSLLVGVVLFAVLVGAFLLVFWLGQQSVLNRLATPARRVNSLPDESQSGLPSATAAGDTRDSNRLPPATDMIEPDKNETADSGQPSGADPSNPADNDIPPSTEPPTDTAPANTNGKIVDQPAPPRPADPSAADTDIPLRPDISLPTAVEVSPATFIGPVLPPRVVAKTGKRQILVLTRPADAGDWQPLPTASELLEGDAVHVLAGKVAEFSIGEHLQLIAVGPCLFSFGQHDLASDSETINLEFGKIGVKSASSDVDWWLNAGDDKYRVTMLLAGAAVQVQASRYLPPGIDPRNVQPALIKSLHSTAGRCRVQSGDEVWNLPQRTALVEVECAIPEVAEAPRTGVVKEMVAVPDFVLTIGDVIERNARIWEMGQVDVISQLLDLKTDPRKEIRLAAMIWLAEQGNFSFVIDYIDNPANDSNWRSFIPALRRIIIDRPEFAQQLFDGLIYAGQEIQPTLYGLILGFSPQDLEAGGDARLVEFLNHADFGIRVLAIENLRQITGGVTYGYLPTKPQVARNQSVTRQWIPRLKTGGIRYAEPPAEPKLQLSSLPRSDESQPATDATAPDGN